MNQCIACGSYKIEPFYNPGPQPLAAFNLPKTQEDAINAARYPMNFYHCQRCGHVFNKDFDVEKIPYTSDSNLMYNTGVGWQEYIDTWLDNLGDVTGKTVLDIGAGDGGVLNLLRARGANCIAFEPGTEAKTCELSGLQTICDYFIPERDLHTYDPDILLCRHVIEHLSEPRKFIEDIAAVAKSELIFAIEVPAITKNRATDFLYEHVNNFVGTSLQMMCEQAGWDTLDIRLGYNAEVLAWTGKPIHQAFKHASEPYYCYREVNQFIAENEVVLWGGTGKGAAFLNTYHITGDRVVDSDTRKQGKYVPGTGQLIESPTILRGQSVLITTRWRAADIYTEILTNKYPVSGVYVVDSCLHEYTEKDYEQEKESN